MLTVNTHEAKTQLSRLIELVQSGEDVVIARAGKPIAVLSRFVAAPQTIAPPGAMAGQGWIADDFDDPVDSLFDALGDDADAPEAVTPGRRPGSRAPGDGGNRSTSGKSGKRGKRS